MTPVVRAPFVAVGTLLALTLTASPVLATGGSLDPSFSGDGVVRISPPYAGFATAQGLDVRVGPYGRSFVFEALVATTDGQRAVGFLRVRAASGGILSSYIGNGTLPVTSSPDGYVDDLGLFPLDGGGILYGVVRAEGPNVVSESVIHRSADGHVIKSAGIPGVLGDLGDSLSRLTRLPGGSIRACARTATGGGDEIRLVGLTPTLAPDSRLGPSNYTVLPVASCVGVTSDAAGRTYVLGATSVAGDEAVEVSAYDPDGALITSWGVTGHQTIALAGSDVRVAKGQIKAAVDGSMMIPAEVQGTGAGSKPAAAILSLGPGGVMNSSFSGDGIATFSPVGGSSFVWAMDLDTSGRPIVSIVSWLDGGGVRAMLARVTTAGMIDTAFGQGGFVTLKRAARDLDVDRLNRIVSVALDGTTVVLTRRT